MVSEFDSKGLREHALTDLKRKQTYTFATPFRTFGGVTSLDNSRRELFNTVRCVFYACYTWLTTEISLVSLPD